MREGDRIFRRYQETAATPSRYAAFDLETVGLDGSILGCGWQVEGDPEPHITTDPEELVRAMLHKSNVGVVWYAHNGGSFDFLHLAQTLRRELDQRFGDDWIINWINRGDNKMLALSVSLKTGTWYGRKRILTWRDSLGILATTLEQLAKQFATVQKQAGTIDFEGGEIWDASNPLHIHYLEADVTALLQSMCTLRDLFWNQYHVNMRLTAAATGMRIFQSMMPEDVVLATQYGKYEDFALRGKFGGYTFLTSIVEHQDVDAFDVNSLYPYVMRDNVFPVGLPHWVPGRLFDQTRELGMWECDIYCEDRDIIPIIPYRTKDGGVMWPIGKFTSVLTTPEILYARTIGYTIRPRMGLVYGESSRLFQDFITAVQGLKTNNPGTQLAALAKIVMNSVYGKFGQRRLVQRLIESPEQPDPQATPALDSKMHVIPGLWQGTDTIKGAYIQPQVAAYITAYARVYYHQLMQRVGGRATVLYGDTDSMAVAHSSALTALLPIDPVELGSLKHENHFRTFQAVAPKTWTGVRDDGSPVYRSKGIPRKLRGDGSTTVEWRSLQGTRTSLRRGEGPTLTTQKRSLPTGPHPSRWELDADGSVHPLRIDAILG